MEQTLYKPLPYRHIYSAAKDSVENIRKRKNNEIKSLRSRWKKFNRIIGGGIDPNRIYSFSGISGSGKSSLVNELESDLITLNQQEDLIILNFSLEMQDSQQITRKISSKLRETTATLNSSHSTISDELFDRVRWAANEIRNYPIYYVNVMPDVTSIVNTIKHFQEVVAKDKWLIVFLDHTLLVKGGSDRTTIIELQNQFIDLKKIGKTTIIQITQMNRDIEKPERINNITGHYPMRSDLSSSDSIFQGSDVVAVIHRPETLNILYYGPHRLPVQNMVYLHILKNREGELAILEFENDLKYNNLIEPERGNN